MKNTTKYNFHYVLIKPMPRMIIQFVLYWMIFNRFQTCLQKLWRIMHVFPPKSPYTFTLSVSDLTCDNNREFGKSVSCVYLCIVKYKPCMKNVSASFGTGLFALPWCFHPKVQWIPTINMRIVKCQRQISLKIDFYLNILLNPQKWYTVYAKYIDI